ncbi:MAG TPA: AraC family transcriptional regulator [Polyangiaceae bacterium]
MSASAAPRIAARASRAFGASEASGVAALFVDECVRDVQGVALPGPEVQLVVRFGPNTQTGLDVHAMGCRESVHRKLLRRGQRIVGARLQLGAAEAVLGVPASAITGRIVALEDLWGSVTTRRLFDRFADARDTFEAAGILESVIAERFALSGGQRAHTHLVLDAANRLASASVNAVAVALGLSERHLRRVFRETTGVSPKAFAKLTRFRRAVRAARAEKHEGWATIAASAGYYDQAHLISEFRAIAGVTPRVFLGELGAAQAIG